MIGILFALMLTQSTECKVTALADPVVVVCGSETLDIPLEEWPKEWGKAPVQGLRYFMTKEGEPLQVQIPRATLPPWDIERERWQRQPLQNDFALRPDN